MIEAEPTVVGRLSFGLLIVFLFIIFSRIFDVKLSYLHIPGITFRFLALFLVLTGSFVAAFRDRIGKCVLGFTAFFVLAIPFSVWRGGSVDTFMNSWLTALVVFVATAALIPDFQRYLKAANTIAYAMFVLTLISLAFGTVQDGRLMLDAGRFANPNEMAQALLLGMPFWWAIAMTSRGLFWKLAGTGTLALMLYTISKTGSRGALISIGVIALSMFLRSSAVGKLKLLITVGFLLAVAVLTLPANLKQRYLTFFTPDTQEESADQPNDQYMIDSAVSSANEREQMFKRSLIVTFQHPLFGVGPGMFMVAEDQMAREEGRRKGAWLGTHNTFTQVSSECGIPAFLFYAGIVVLSFKRSYSLYRRTKNHPEWKEISTHALALHYSLIAFIVTGVFIHAAYTALLPVLAGMTISMARTAEPLLAGNAGRQGAWYRGESDSEPLDLYPSGRGIPSSGRLPQNRRRPFAVHAPQPPSAA